MRRGKPVHPRMYIEMRIEQLKQERTKSNDKMTRMWLWKCIDELRYVLQVMDKREYRVKIILILVMLSNHFIVDEEMVRTRPTGGYRKDDRLC